MTLEEPNNLPFDVDEEFIKQNQKLNSKNTPKRGGPYTKNEREQRRQEVYRLNFDYGYSAKKIAKLMRINRNTVNGDIDYWYSRIVKKSSIFNPEYSIIINLQRLEIQRSRLREQLDKVESFQEKLALERLIYEIDSKILHIHHRLTETMQNIHDHAIEKLNRWMKDHKREERFMTLFDKMMVSGKTHEKVTAIINKDRLRAKLL